MPEHRHPIERFPHLLPWDAAIWRAFLQRNGQNYQTFEYDVRVGNGRDPGPDFSQNIRNMAIRLSQRRIDAVGFQPGTITLFEITGSIGMTALGQCHAYPILYRIANPGNYTLRTILVAAHLQDDIKPSLIARQIPYFLLPQVKPPQTPNKRA